MENMIVGAILAITYSDSVLKDIKPTLVIACSIPLSVVLQSFDVFYRNIVKYHFIVGLALGVPACLAANNSIVVIENITESSRNQDYRSGRRQLKEQDRWQELFLHPRSQRSVCLRRSFLRRNCLAAVCGCAPHDRLYVSGKSGVAATFVPMMASVR